MGDHPCLDTTTFMNSKVVAYESFDSKYSLVSEYWQKNSF